ERATRRAADRARAVLAVPGGGDAPRRQHGELIPPPADRGVGETALGGEWPRSEAVVPPAAPGALELDQDAPAAVGASGQPERPRERPDGEVVERVDGIVLAAGQQARTGTDGLPLRPPFGDAGLHEIP